MLVLSILVATLTATRSPVPTPPARDGEHNSQQVPASTTFDRVVTRLAPHDLNDPGPVCHHRRCKRLDLLRNEGI